MPCRRCWLQHLPWCLQQFSISLSPALQLFHSVLDAGFDPGSTDAEAATHAKQAHAFDEVATQPLLMVRLKIAEHLQQPVPLVILIGFRLFELVEPAACDGALTAITVLVKTPQSRHFNGLPGLLQTTQADAEPIGQLLL